MDIPRPGRPVEFSTLAGLVAVRFPYDSGHVMHLARGQWEPGTRLSLIERRRIGSVILTLRRTTDTLFRQAGIGLDEGRARTLAILLNTMAGTSFTVGIAAPRSPSASSLARASRRMRS